MIEGVTFTPLSIIATEGGDVLHGMKSSDIGYDGFGEAYFSSVNTDAIKGWKRHRQMVLNLIVPVGAVRFIMFDDRSGSSTTGHICEFILSYVNYGRLTVPPNIWLAFQGVAQEKSLLLNIANIPHDADEVDKIELDNIIFDWD